MMIEILPDDTPEGHDDGHASLLLRKHRYAGTISYYLCWTPVPVPLAKLVSVAARWRIGFAPSPRVPALIVLCTMQQLHYRHYGGRTTSTGASGGGRREPGRRVPCR